DEPHDPKTMEKAADEFLSRLGADPKRMRGKSKPKARQFADEHQVAMWGHSDTGKPHLHISINRIHPQTGRLLPDSMDYQRAQKWALEFSKRHGTDHKTPLREENAKLRQQGEYVKGPRRKSRNAFEMEKALKAVSNDNSRVQAAIDHEKAKDAVLAKRQRNMAAMHQRERDVLVAAHKERKAAIARRQQRQANAEKAAVRELFRPRMRELYRQQEAERRTFDSLETNMFGRAANMVKAVKLSAQDVSEHKSAIISRTFRILTNAGERKAFFERAQERARAALLAERRQEQDDRLNTLREAYSAKQDANRAVLFKERSDLLARQAADKLRMAEAWKQRQPERMVAYAKAAEIELFQKQMAERREHAKETAPPIAPDFRKADKRKVANDDLPGHGGQGDDRDDTSGEEDGSDDSGGMIKGVPDHILKAKEAYSAAQEQDNSPEPDYDRPLDR
ncbi:MAG: relaxase/mobilization nuclease domain-containing protein, partial [Pseudomonadota bacterium]